MRVTKHAEVYPGGSLYKYCFFVQVSKISLVDLAGSERAKDTGAEGKRLQVREREREEREREEGGEGDTETT